MKYNLSLNLTSKITLLVLTVVALSLSITAAGISYYIAAMVKEDLGNSIMSIAKTVATHHSIIEAIERQQGPDAIQEIAEKIRMTTGARYIVVFDRQSRRWSHPNPSEIGLTVVGGDERPALEGKEYLSIGQGTLGDSLRAFTPIRAPNGEVIGGVVVGTLMDKVSSVIWDSIKVLLFVMGFGLVTGCIGSYLLARNIKKSLFGWEPEEIAAILEERNAVLQGIKEGVIVINKAGKVTLLNEASLKLLNDSVSSKYLEQPVEEVIPNTRLNEVLRTGQPENDQIQDINGKLIVTNRLPVTVRGRVVGAVATFRDMTEVKTLAAELAGIKTYTEALRAQTHEFMNKLHVLWGLTQLECYDEVSDYIASIVSTAETEAQFVINRIKNPAIAGLLIAKFSTIREAGAKLTLEADSALDNESFLATSDLITILGNLIDNAMEAMRFQVLREICVFIHGNFHELEIVVSDTGPGIAPGINEKIFDWGYSTKGGQRGIGLFLVRQTVEKYHGSIYYENHATGCCFHVECEKQVEEG